MQADAPNWVIDLICEFLEAVTHEILFLRNIYDRDIFARQRLYDIAVHKARHPELSEFIATTLGSLKEAIARSHVQKVAITIAKPGGSVVERYVLKLKVLPSAHKAKLQEFEGGFRGCLLKLQYADSCMPQLPPGCTFDIVAYTTERAGVPTNLWVEEDTSSSDEAGSLSALIPIKSTNVANGTLKIQLHAETL